MVHSIGFDPSRPSRLIVGVSAAGAFRSDDGGASWTPKNAGVRADFLPDKFPAVGQCVHHMEMHPQRPEVLYQQNHCGVYRSDDGGDSWNDISNGLPSRFGFPFTTLPHDGDTVFVIPEESDQARMTADATTRHLPQPQSRRVVGPADQRVAAVRRVSERDADGDDAPIRSTRRVSTSVLRAAICSPAATAATRGRWCSIGCRRSTRWKPPWFDRCRDRCRDQPLTTASKGSGAFSTGSRNAPTCRRSSS